MLEQFQVPPEGPSTARIMIAGEAPGETEVRCRRPFVGLSGQELDRMLHEAGIMRSDCFITNVTPIRPPGNDISSFFHDKACRLPKVEIEHGIALLRDQVAHVRPTVIIALGDTALWALTGERGITKWRGSVLESKGFSGCKVLPTYHPAAILRMWEWRAVAVHDLRRAARESLFPEIRKPPYQFLIRPSLEQVLETLLHLHSLADQGPCTLSVDIETRHGHISCIGIAWSPLRAICIPLMSIAQPEGYWGPDSELAILLTLRELLTHPNVKVLGQNFSYDAQYFIKHFGYCPRFADDTMIAQHVLFAGSPKSLDFIASLHCEYYRYWKDDGKEWNPKLHDETRHWTYNCEDAVRTYEVHWSLQEALDKLNLRQVYERQIRLWWSALRTMLRGVRIDRKFRNELSGQLFEQIAENERWLHAAVGYDLSPKSPKQMMRFFYEEMGQRTVLKRKTGKPTADEEALKVIAKREPLLAPIIKRVLDIRSLGVLLSTFVQAPLDPDGRIRCSYNIAGTETFRFASSANAFGSGTNLQNVPPSVRRLFIPDPGYIFFDIDLDRADLQVVVWEADDEELRAALREGADIHSLNAKTLGISRPLAKAWVHGTNYGGSARTMAINCGIPVHQAELMRRRWFEAHPGIKRWHERTERNLQQTRSVTNRFGYRRFYFGRVEALLPEALAWVPQSTVANVINQAWVNIEDQLPDVQVLLQVHDSLAGQIPNRLVPSILPKLRAACLIPIPYSDPLTIPCGLKLSSRSWGDVTECDWESGRVKEKIQ